MIQVNEENTSRGISYRNFESVVSGDTQTGDTHHGGLCVGVFIAPPPAVADDAYDGQRRKHEV